MSDENWEQARDAGIGGSDAAACMGLSPFTTPLQLWSRKIGESSGPRFSPAMEWGQRLERAVLGKMEDEHGVVWISPLMVAAECSGEDSGSTAAALVADRIRHIVTPRVFDDGHVLWTPSRPMPYGAESFMLASGPDGFCMIDGDLVIMEAKTTRYGDKHWSDGVPHLPLLQVHHYMAVFGTQRSLVGCFGRSGCEWWSYHVDADPNLTNALIHAEAEMVRRIIEDDPPPATDGDAPPKERTRPRQVRVQLGLGEAGALHGMLDTMVATSGGVDAPDVVALRDKLAKAVSRGAAP